MTQSRHGTIEENQDIMTYGGLIRVQPKYWECTSIQTDAWLNEMFGAPLADFDLEEIEEKHGLAKSSGWVSDSEEHILIYLQEKTGREYVAACDPQNTYNGESDLYDCIIYQVFLPSDDRHVNGDWWYADDVYVAVQRHAGGDPRGNYHGVDIYGPVDHLEETGFLENMIGWYLETLDGEPADDEGRFDVGYSSNPTYELSKALVGGRAIWFAKHGCFLGRLKSIRRTVKMFPQVRTCS